MEHCYAKKEDGQRVQNEAEGKALISDKSYVYRITRRTPCPPPPRLPALIALIIYTPAQLQIHAQSRSHYKYVHSTTSHILMGKKNL